MNRCPISYELLGQGEKYSAAGLRSLAPGLKSLSDLPFTAVEQRREAVARAGRMSVQGVQPKLSARLSVRGCCFTVVDRHGRFILKPQSVDYSELPENEDLSMRLAGLVGIEVPTHGMVFSRDGSLTYFIKRFDRTGRRLRLPVEDFAQLTGRSRETKYDSSMERVASVVESYCTFPLMEKKRLLTLTLFSFLAGNQDMHLKNFSLITRDERVEISPAYDLLNSTIAMPGAEDEFALPLNGKTRRLTRKDFVDYFARGRLALRPAVIEDVLEDFTRSFDGWERLIDASFLSEGMKEKYLEVVTERRRRLGL